MFEQLLKLLPREPGTLTVIVACMGSLIGVGFWLVGARFSRSILTLAAVGLGAGIGMKLPQWCGWTVDGMGPAVGGAVILGVSAFVVHRLWVGLWLGVVLAAWIALGLWTSVGHRGDWRWPAYDAAQTLPQYLTTVWHALPMTMQRYLPLCSGAAVLACIGVTAMWPRIGLVLMWSAAGMSLLLAMGTLTLARLCPTALRMVPRHSDGQLALLGGLVGAGALLQWRMTPRSQASAGPGKASKKGK